MFHTNLVCYMRIKKKTPKDFYNNKDPRLNISKSQFFKLRRGDDYPHVDTILKMAKVLGISHKELIKHDAEEEKKKETPDDFDKFFDEEFEPAFKKFLSYHENCERRERIKFGIACVCGFIVITAWFLMLYVAFQS